MKLNDKEKSKLVKKFGEDLLKKSGYDMRSFEPFIKESEKFVEKIIRKYSKIIEKENE